MSMTDTSHRQVPTCIVISKQNNLPLNLTFCAIMQGQMEESKRNVTEEEGMTKPVEESKGQHRAKQELVTGITMSTILSNNGEFAKPRTLRDNNNREL